MWLIKASLRNPHMVFALVAGIVMLGLFALARIPIDILPVFKSPAVQVLTYYPGMPAASIEKTITNRLERWVGQAPGASLVESRSVPGVSVVKVQFREDIDPNEALTLVNSLALGALPNLPPNTLPPVALPFDATGTLPIGILTVTNPELDDAQQKDIARIDVRNMLGAVPGCIAPVVLGGRDRTVMLYLDPQLMEARNLVPTAVVEALRRNNLMVSPGAAYFGPNQMLLDSNSMFDRVEDFNAMPLVFGGGLNVSLRDIGRAEDSSTIQTSSVLVDGKREVFVPIYRQRGSSSLGVVQDLIRKIPEMEQRLPKGTSLKLVMDQTVAVAQSLKVLVQESILGAVLVSLMLLVFLRNWRMTLIATLSIPLALLGAVAGLYFTGNTLNLMTLSGLALAIGPLVDDAIVELENNHRHHLLGKSRVRAALDGCVEVLVPVLVATCTTMLVLAPLAFLPGMGGFLFRPLAIAVAFAMLVSFMLSRTFVPMMCAKFLPEKSSSHHEFRWLAALGFFYSRCLSWCLGHPRMTVLLVLAVFAVTVPIVPQIGREFFPLVDAGQITIRVRAPSNLRLEAAEERVKAVEEFLRSQIPASERAMIISELGLNPDWSSAYTTNAGQQDSVIRIQLTPERSKSAGQHAIELRKAFHETPGFADLQFEFDTGGMISTALNMGSTSPIDIEIEGGTTASLLKVARLIESLVRPIPGTADVRIRQRNDAPYLVLDVDRVKAAQLALTAEDVILQVVVALNSSVSVNRNFWIDSNSGNQYFVGVQFPEDIDRTLDDILAMPVAVSTPTRTRVNLGALVTPRQKDGEVEIHHSNLKRVANVLANTEGLDLAGVASDIQKAIAEFPLPEGMRISLKGEYNRMNETFKLLAAGLLLAVGLVYLLQVVLFRSWIGPAVIMASVPLGFVGIAWMLWITGTTLNVQSMLGAVFLVGIGVNNGVLLVEFANRRRHEIGLGALEAIREAAAARFRPILMTFLATSLAMAPLALGLGQGTEASTPLARAVIGGLLSSTILTLFLVPVLYAWFVRKAPRVDEGLEQELAAD
jgi:CzcA family heavy metal efflux pump